jgi:hypothetical protein
LFFSVAANSSKIENTEIEAKSETTSNDCENISHGAAADVSTEDSSPAND